MTRATEKSSPGSFSNTERLNSDAAKNQVAMNPINTVFDAKRIISRKFGDVEAQVDMKHLVFSSYGKPNVHVEHRGETKTFVSRSGLLCARCSTLITDP